MKSFDKVTIQLILNSISVLLLKKQSYFTCVDKDNLTMATQIDVYNYQQQGQIYSLYNC